MWQVFRDAIPTRHNLKKRNWMGNPVCSFCNQVETMEHLFFSCSFAKTTWAVLGASIGTILCPRNLWQSIVWFYRFLPGGDSFYMIGLAAVCWSIWTVRNKATFENHVVKSPVEAVFTICSFLLYWAGLQVGDDKDKLVDGARKLMKLAASVTGHGTRCAEGSSTVAAAD
jgi:hypothetical protein